MQMQARPPPTLQFHPTLPPSIPQRDIQNLIPRLSSAINDIDAFKAHLEAGYHDGSLPNWETLLSRYSVLLTRISAISASVSALPLPPQLRPGAPIPPSASVPTLSRYLIHPLNPLPLPGTPAAASISPDAEGLLFQAINTNLMPSVLDPSAELLLGDGASGIGPGQPWVSRDQLRKMPQRELDALVLRLKGRMERESALTERVKESVKEHADQYEWGMRIEDESAQEGEEDDDLFRDDEGEAEKPKTAPNPREGWTLSDYLKFKETGQHPAHLPPPPTQRPDVIDLT